MPSLQSPVTRAVPTSLIIDIQNLKVGVNLVYINIFFYLSS